MFVVSKQFSYGINMNDIGKRAHIINHSHGRCAVGAFDKHLHKGSIFSGHRAVLYFILHKSIFLNSVNHGTTVYYR